MAIIVAPSAEKGRTSRTKRVYFKRSKTADMESIKFETKKIKNNMGDPVIKAVYVTEDKAIIAAFKAKKGFKVLTDSQVVDEADEPKTKEEPKSGEAGNGGPDDLDRPALQAQYEELFGSKAPANIKTETLESKIAEKIAEAKK